MMPSPEILHHRHLRRCKPSGLPPSCTAFEPDAAWLWRLWLGATLLWGFGNSLLIAIGAYAIGFCIGVSGAFGKLLWRSGGQRSAGRLHHDCPRGAGLVLILILYYAVPALLNEVLLGLGYQRIDLPQFITGVIVLAVDCRGLSD